MKKTIKKNPFRYPWKKWTDGKEHKLVAGKDFKTTPDCMASAVYGYARRNGFEASIVTKDGVFNVKFKKLKKAKAA